MTRLGGVPIRVSIPPRLLAKASGMSSSLELLCVAAARLTTMGSIRATVPVLLTKAPMTAVTSITIRKSVSLLFPASFIILLLIIFASPVCRIPPPTTNRPTIIIRTGFEKPARASAGVRMLNRSRDISAHNATTSERVLPIAKNIAEMAKMIMVIIIFIMVFYCYSLAFVCKVSELRTISQLSFVAFTKF